jgi:hypothetical protein
MSRIEDADRERLAMEHGQPTSTCNQKLLKFAEIAWGLSGTQKAPESDRKEVRMNPRKCINDAELHRKRMELALEPLNEKLAEFFDDCNSSIFYQPGDGWCLLFDHDRNVVVDEIDFDLLFSMSQQDAAEYLKHLEV